MEAKDKAKELVSKFRGWAMEGIRSNSNFHAAKECAIICVDEIINFGSKNSNWGIGEPYNSISHKGYWEQVKQEIENL